MSVVNCDWAMEADSRLLSVAEIQKGIGLKKLMRKGNMITWGISICIFAIFMFVSCNSIIDGEKVDVDEITWTYTYKESGKPVTGIVEFYRLDTITEIKYKEIVIEVRDGKPVNKGYGYYPNGNVAAEWQYDKNGLTTGTDKIYRETGQLMEMHEYKDGKLNGISKIFDEQGKLEMTKEYVENVLRAIQQYKDDKLHGLSQFFDENGTGINEENYENGIKITERTFKNCYRVSCAPENISNKRIKWEEKAKCNITVSKRSSNRLTFKVDYDPNDINSIIYWSVYELEFDNRFVKEGKYFYDGIDIKYNSIRIQTFRPLEDFITKGVSSESNLNVVLYWDAKSVAIIGLFGFGVK